MPAPRPHMFQLEHFIVPGGAVMHPLAPSHFPGSVPSVHGSESVLQGSSVAEAPRSATAFGDATLVRAGGTFPTHHGFHHGGVFMPVPGPGSASAPQYGSQLPGFMGPQTVRVFGGGMLCVV